MTMTKRITTIVAVLVAAVAVWLLIGRRQKEVSMLLVNGVVYTVNEQQPVAEAVAIQGDRIVAVGSTEELRSKYAADTTIDLKGKPVYPGFIDSHAHMEELGAALMNLDLSRASSEEEAAALVERAAETAVPGGWIRGRGWDQNLWKSKGFPTRGSLDRVSRKFPVFLTRIDGHAVWVNSRVIALAGINKSTSDPPGGKIIRDRKGSPTGVFIDNAIDLILGTVPPPSVEERTEAIRRSVNECLPVGLSEVHDMGVDLQGIDIYKRLIATGEFPFRVYVAVSGTAPGAWEHYMSTGPEVEGYDNRLVVRAVKMYADGALGSRGAALLDAYSDDPGNRGLTLTSKAGLLRIAGEALDHGFQLCTHAIGDRANAIVLDVYSEAFTSHNVRGEDVRFRIEHAQVLAPADIPRFARLGVFPMMQPTHCTSDMPWAEDRLGPSRITGAYAWRSLLNAGSIIPAGSDFPVESPNPLWGFYAAITRQNRDGQPPGGWHPEQRMTREEALKAFTVWGARAAFQEKLKGTLEPGKWADIIVLSDDLMKVDPPKILSTAVVMNIIAGKIVYETVSPNGHSAR
jgi:predicted amidohydrolase YtcJ